MYFYQTYTIFGITFSIKFYTEKVISFSILLVPKPDKQTYGLSSRCKGGKHITVVDFDGLEQEEVDEEIEAIIQEYKTSDWIIAKNDIPKSFHGYCLDKLKLYEVLEIISSTSADKGFKKAPWLFKQRRWIIRISEKGNRKRPQFLKIIKSPYDQHETSTAHKKFLEINYNIKLKKYNKEDGIKDFVDICEYNTGNRVK